MADAAAVQAAIEAFASGDPERIVKHVHPDFEGIVPPSMSAEPDSYIGHDGVRLYFELFEETISDLEFRSTALEEHGDYVIAELLITGKGRTSGLPVELPAFAVIEMRDGKLLRMAGYPSIEEARAALPAD